MNSPNQLKVSKLIRASRERVFAAWTRPELLKTWFGPGDIVVSDAQADARVGGGFRIQMRMPDGAAVAVAGRYRRIVPGECLEFSWAWEGSPGAETLVVVQFRELDGATEVTVTHEGFADTDSRDRHRQGWDGCLAKLQQALGRADAARIGNHMKINIPPALRERAQRFYVELLGCEVLASPAPELDLYRFVDGFVVGLFSVAEAELLSEKDHLKATWLELKVADLAAMRQRLEAFGVAQVDYADRSRFYFQAPGGQVFRLAALDGGI